MDLSERALTQFYEAQLEAGPDDAKRVGWESLRHQMLRFEGLLQIFGQDTWHEELTLLDVGCGLGDLYTYLKSTGRPVRYTGIDISAEMVNAARQRHPEATFFVSDIESITEDYDLIVACGTFGVSFEPGAANWQRIAHLFGRAKKAFAFNLLKRLDGDTQTNLRQEYWRVDGPEAYHQLNQISPTFTLRQDILPTDFIVYFYRGHIRVLDGPLSPPAEALERAEILLEREAFEAARSLLAQAPEKNARWNHLMALALAQDGREEATAFFHRAHHLAPDDIEIAANGASFLLALGAVEKAEGIIVATLKTTAGTATERDFLRYLLHEKWVEGRNFERAAVLEIGAQTEFARCLMRGGRLIRVGDFEAATKNLDEARALAPMDLRVVIYQGQLAKALEAPELCLKYAAEILNLEPAHHGARDLAYYGLTHLKHLLPAARKEALMAYRGHSILGKTVTRMLSKL